MSESVNAHTISSPDVKQLMRNMIILPVVRANFASDRLFFENGSRYGRHSPYAAVAGRAMRRIDEDMATIARQLGKAGCTPGEQVRERGRITRSLDCHGEPQTFSLRWGTFEGELENYYLGNFEYTPDRGGDER